MYAHMYTHNYIQNKPIHDRLQLYVIMNYYFIVLTNNYYIIT